VQRKIYAIPMLAIALIVAVGLWVTKPITVDQDLFENLTADAKKGERIFNAAGCRSCHKAEGTDALAGGMSFPSPFGTFKAPNVSMDATNGIGSWSLNDFANAVQKGVSPDGKHYYPAFPYGTYARMNAQDIADLWAYIQTLPADSSPSQPHDVGFPFNIRRGLGLWKISFISDDWIVEPSGNEVGRYLVEALGHCGECHTPRNALGGLTTKAWLSGAPDPSGKGTIPSILPSQLGWSKAEIIYYLEVGFTPDFDSAGGHMTDVIENMSRLPAADREAIANYLLGLQG